MYNLIIGSHVSYKNELQLIGSVKEALSYGSNTFMFYTGAPQNTSRNPIDDSKTLEALKIMKENGIKLENILVHAPYIINPANKKNFDFNVSFLKQEISRVEMYGVTMMVLHPGSHVGVGIEEGLNNIIDVLNSSIDENTNIDICIETMAGKGTELGITFDQIKTIIDGVKYNNKIKVCLDTCHISDAGYDLSDFDYVLEEFDKIIGIDKLRCVHINDSKNIMGAHKDRHENVGYGYIGFDNLLKIIYHEKLDGIPKFLETPYIKSDKDSYPPYKFEIEAIRNKKFNDNLINDIINYYENR